ncbi:hypothetical protein Agabi119p4_6890 [Agaricus bisporus var. burnettii]|uniref:Uncharacterized protein n=1 Tax=Agaricus bisporus var. burnettii TaxID=192524 RepID=A0A8H7F0C8_AGABI|nr:hypothetical protein Agabi119p4_6890 [Agaricus bisporus var. burnettii]
MNQRLRPNQLQRQLNWLRATHHTDHLPSPAALFPFLPSATLSHPHTVLQPPSTSLRSSRCFPRFFPPSSASFPLVRASATQLPAPSAYFKLKTKYCLMETDSFVAGSTETAIRSEIHLAR